MEDQITLSQINSGNTTYYLMTTTHKGGKDGFDLKLSNGYKGWMGSVKKPALSKLCEVVKMKFEDYIIETTKALTQKQVGNLHFQYQVKLGGDSATLIWKKHVPSENIKFQLGQAVLDECPEPADVINSIFRHSIEATSSLQETINALETDNQRLAAERASALKRLEKCVSAKEDLEKDLYSKFAIVINDKKAKIRDLKEEVNELSQAVPSTSNASPPANKQRKISSGSEEEEEEEKDVQSDYEYDTDDEKKETPPKKKAKTGKASVKYSPDRETSLLLDVGDEEEEEVRPTARRQRRGKAAKTTPSRPILPKAGSATKGSKNSSETTPGRTPLRSRTSRGSSSFKSGDEVDDLLELL